MFSYVNNIFSIPLLGKWLFHQTSMFKWLFRVPGVYYIIIYSICILICVRMSENESLQKRVEFVVLIFVGIA